MHTLLSFQEFEHRFCTADEQGFFARIMLSVGKSNTFLVFRMRGFYQLYCNCIQLLKSFLMTVNNLSSLTAVNKGGCKRRKLNFFASFMKGKEKHFLMFEINLYSLNSSATVLLHSNSIAVSVEK